MLKKKLDIQNKHLPRITRIIKEVGGNVRLVGGIVRDSLLGISGKDIDLATDLLPEQIQEIFSNQNIKVIPTGIKFGTITVVMGGQNFEITTLRCDTETDGRHAKVAYSTDFKVDAERRDFTINALSYDLDEEKLYDYFDGLEDLESGVVRFIGDAKKRIEEDYLRILRFFRFSARYAKEIDKTSLVACSDLADGIDQLSGERIKAEMDQILTGPKSHEMISKMISHNIWPHLFGSKNPNLELFQNLSEKASQLDAQLDLATIYAQIFIDQRDLYDCKKLLSLKFTRRESQSIKALYEILAILDQEQLIIELSRKWIEDDSFIQYILFCLTNSDYNRILELYMRLKEIKVKPRFPLKAQDLQEVGLSGKALGDTLEQMENEWIRNDFKLDRARLLDLINK